MNKRKVPKIRFKGFYDDWEQRKFNNVSDKLCVGFVGTCERYYTDETHGIPMYRTGNIKDGFLVEDDMKFVTRDFHEKNKKSQLKKNDILIARFGENGLGAQYLKDEEANCLNCIILRSNAQVDVEYVKQYLSSDAFRKKAFANTVGSTFSILNTTTLGKMDIPFTSLTEQHAIAGFLSKIDHLITLHQKKCLEWKKRDFTSASISWEQREFSDLYAPLVERNSDLLPYNKTLSVATMTYKTDGNGAADSSLANYKRLRTGDIAFEGHTSKSFRYGRFVLNDVGDGIMSPRFSALRPLAQMPTNFWKYYIHYEPIMRKILVASTKAGTMMNELVIDEFLKSSVLVPSIEEQTWIGSILKNIDHLITLHQSKLEKLKMIKKSMLETMFI